MTTMATSPNRKRRLSSILKSELLNKKKKTMNVRTSFKLKRPFLHPLMTPRLQNHQPRACSTALRAASRLSGSTALKAIPRPSDSTALKAIPRASGSTALGALPGPSDSTALRAASGLSGSTALKAIPRPSGSSALRAVPAPSGSTACRAASGSFGTSCLPQASSSSSVKKGRPSLSTIYRPSCKRSLYGKLPTGKRPTEGDTQDLSDDPECPPLSTISEGFMNNNDKPGKVSQRRSVDKLSEKKHNRRSIDQIIERYKQHKAKMNETINGSQC